MAGARPKGLHGQVVPGGGVAQGDGTCPGYLRNKGQGALLLGGHGYQAHLSPAGLVEAAEHGHIRLVQVIRRLGAPLGVGQEGALQVDPGAPGAVLRADKVPDGVHGPDELLLGQGHGGRTEGGDSLLGEQGAHGLQGFRSGVPRVGPGAAVDVHIDKAGQDGAARQVVDRFVIRSARRADAFDRLSRNDQIGGDGLKASVYNFGIFQKHFYSSPLFLL